MKEFIIYLVTLGFIYLVYFALIITNKKRKIQYKKSSEIIYLERKYKLDVNKIGMNKLMHILALANAFIIANTMVIINLVDGYLFKIMLGFVVILPMIIGVYHLVGTYYQSHGGK